MHHMQMRNFTFVVSLNRNRWRQIFKFTDNGSCPETVSSVGFFFCQKKLAAPKRWKWRPGYRRVLPPVTHLVRAHWTPPNGTDCTALEKQTKQKKIGSRIDRTSSFRFPSKFFTAFLISDDADKPATKQLATSTRERTST